MLHPNPTALTALDKDVLKPALNNLASSVFMEGCSVRGLASLFIGWAGNPGGEVLGSDQDLIGPREALRQGGDVKPEMRFKVTLLQPEIQGEAVDVAASTLFCGHLYSN